MRTPLPTLPSFPPVAKLFVGLFTTLMLAVCFWAGWLYYVDQGEVDAQRAAIGNALGRSDRDLAQYLEDSSEVIAPVWDSLTAGREMRLDSADAIDLIRRQAQRENRPTLRENLGLAHTHINGQTLLFFAIGLVFLFSTAPVRTKRITYLTLAAAILVHTVGLSGRGCTSLFDDLLAISGVIILALIVYMAGIIYMDLLRVPHTSKSENA